eukprot:5571096-Amphidinium_carterae.1
MMTSRLSTEKVSPARAAEKAAEIEIGVTAGPDRQTTAIEPIASRSDSSSGEHKIHDPLRDPPRF